MKLEYTNLKGGPRIKVSFDYSLVSSTPRLSVEQWTSSHFADNKDSTLIQSDTLENDAAVEGARFHLDQARKFTTLHDK